MQTAEPLERRRFTAEEVALMVERGILAEDDHVELLEGDLVVTPPQGPPHSSAVSDLDDRLRRAYGGGYHVRPQCPVGGATHSLPEPDLAVVRGTARDYSTRHPTGTELVLVVEVARTSHAVDHGKIRIYARLGVPVYWILDLVGRRLELHEEPTPEGDYRVARVLTEHESIALPGLDVIWTVTSMLT